MENSKSKAKYWCAVMYPESMIDTWQEDIGGLLEYPYAYCVHDKCFDKNGEIRKKHVHIMIAFTNTNTYNVAMKLFSRLGTVNTCQAVMNVRNMYDYLIHDTEDCKKKNKFLYSSSERILGNNFDIGNYEQLSVVDKQKIKRDLMNDIIKNDFQDFFELTLYVYSKYADDVQILEVFEGNHGFYNNIVKGNFLHKQRLRNGELEQ